MSEPILFKDLPMGSVYRVRVNPTEWWMRVPDGAILVNEDGSVHPQWKALGVAPTRDDLPCFPSENTVGWLRLNTFLEFLDRSAEQNRILLREAMKPWMERLDYIRLLQRAALDDLTAMKE